MKSLRDRAALIICVGVAITAFSITIGGREAFRDAVGEPLAWLLWAGYVTFFGAALSALGLYYWLTDARH